MKKTIKISALLLVMIALFSCESMDVMKRRYTGGFYVHHSKGNKSNDSKSVKNDAAKAEPIVAGNTVVTESSVETEVAEVTNTEGATTSSEIQTVNNNDKGTAANVETETNEVEKEAVTIKAKKELNYTKEERQQLDYNAGGAAEVELIVLILLSIFVPPLAVYLKKGGIDKWFWVTLILCILAIFGVWAFYLGGLWFVAFVIALLVVLDILS